MRATVDAKAFSEALNHVGRVPRQSTIPVLAGVLVRFENGRCSITGTDFTTWLTITRPAVGDDFTFLLDNPSDASKACRFFDGKLTLELHGKNPKYPSVTLSCGHRSGTFNAFPEEDYPEQPKLEAGASFTASAAALLKRIERVKYAVRVPEGSSDSPQRTCVQFSGNDVFCLDGYRAACDTDSALSFPGSPEADGRQRCGGPCRRKLCPAFLGHRGHLLPPGRCGDLSIVGCCSKELPGGVFCFSEDIPAGVRVPERLSI